MRKHIFTSSVIFLFLIIPNAFAHIDFKEVEPISLEEEGNDSYKFIFIILGTKQAMRVKKEKTILHIRFNPRCYTEGIKHPEKNSERKKEYFEAIESLKIRVKDKKSFTFGFHGNPIKGKSNEYQAESLRILESMEKKFVWSVKSDLSTWKCEE
jgi:hypothetical protein